jgi:hypothetical protein
MKDWSYFAIHLVGHYNLYEKLDLVKHAERLVADNQMDQL